MAQAAAAALWAAAAAASGAHGHHDHHHHHVAPHGGTLVVLGEEFAHLELVVDRKTGAMTAYVLDGEAERGVAISQTLLEIDAAPSGGDPFTVQLAPVENVLTGETSGNTSQFAGEADPLKTLRRFEGEVRQIEVRGQRFEAVAFRFPEGNEDGEDAR
ncbi:MAG: hypothetical protein AAF430_21425 [Myxococcota bacterium]